MGEFVGGSEVAQEGLTWRHSHDVALILRHALDERGNQPTPLGGLRFVVPELLAELGQSLFGLVDARIERHSCSLELLLDRLGPFGPSKARAFGSVCIRIGKGSMTVEQARQQLLALIEKHGGHVSVALIEADKQLAANREVASAAARQLATEPEITAGEETDKPLYWFPYSFLERDDAAA